MRKLLLLIALLLPLSIQAQHIFEYVCETNAVEFYIDSYIGQPNNGIYTIWEKRVLTKTPAGQAEGQRLAKIYPDLKLDAVTHYYVKQKFDIENLRTKTLAVYFFNAKNDEVASKRYGDNREWEDISPETVADLEMSVVRQWAEKKK